MAPEPEVPPVAPGPEVPPVTPGLEVPPVTPGQAVSPVTPGQAVPPVAQGLSALTVPLVTPNTETPNLDGAEIVDGETPLVDGVEDGDLADKETPLAGGLDDGIQSKCSLHWWILLVVIILSTIYSIDVNKKQKQIDEIIENVQNI